MTTNPRHDSQPSRRRFLGTAAIRHANYALRIDPISTTTDRADATFSVIY
ncbi:hypothetical protein ABZ137_39050 [Streptomyces bobili]